MKSEAAVRKGLLAGAIAGFLGTGIGGRIVMRIIAIVDPHTEVEFTDGTMFLLIFGGIFGAAIGALGGALYMGTRGLLPGCWVWKGLAFGSVWLLTAGAAFFSMGQSEAFADFEPPLLGVGLFAFLFIIYGLTVTAIVERMDMWMPALPGSRIATVGGLGAVAAVSLAGLLLHIRAIGSILNAAG